MADIMDMLKNAGSAIKNMVLPMPGMGQPQTQTPQEQGGMNPQDFIGYAQHYLQNSPLGGIVNNPNLIFPSQNAQGQPTTFAAHPRATNMAEGALTALGSMQGIPVTPGQSAAMVAGGIMAYPQAKRQLRMQQLALPFELASNMTGMQKTIAEANSQNAFANLRNSMAQVTGTQASSRALAAFLGSKAYMNPDGSVNQEAFVNGLHVISQLHNTAAGGAMMNMDTGDIMSPMPGGGPLSSTPLMTQQGLDTNINAGARLEAAVMRPQHESPLDLWLKDPEKFARFKKAESEAAMKGLMSPTAAAHIMDYAYRYDPRLMPFVQPMIQNLAKQLKMDLPPEFNIQGSAAGQPIGSTGAAIGTAMPEAPTSVVRARGQMSSDVLQRLPDIRQQVAAMKDQLGPLSGRWQEFMTGQVGANNPQFAALRDNLHTLAGAMSRLHLNTEAGLTPFNEMMSAGKMTPANINAALDTMEKWAKTYQYTGSGNQPNLKPQQEIHYKIINGQLVPNTEAK